MEQYYYSDGLQKNGPFSLEELRSARLSRNTMVWKHPMQHWVPAEQMPELQDLFKDQPPEFSRSFSPSRRPPKSWLVESILVTFFCCMPFGIAGIVNAARVETKFSAGDYEGAQRSSEEAGKWTKIGFWIAVAGVLIYFVFLAIVIAANQF